MRSPTLFLLTILFATVLRADRGLAQTPGVAVENIRRAFHNGEHNAFTDLVRWRGKFWLCFRSCPDGHMVFPTSSIIVLASDDTREWRQVHRFSVPKRDTRDPHFLIFKDRLFVYTGTWYSGDGELPREEYDLNRHLGYAVVTTDGETWESPRQLEGTHGHYIWRAAVRGDTAYLCGRRKLDYAEGVKGETRIVQSALLESEDGLRWRFRGLFQENRGDETAFLFQSNGDLLAVSRSGSAPAQVVKSSPPFEAFSRTDLAEYVGGPLLTRWGDRFLVGGRRNTKDGPKTVLYWLENDALVPFAELPSGGDNSYPGFVELDDGRGLVSWYSSHEKDETGKTITAIYLAELRRK
ncbi:MAG: hypothetical protein H7A53_02690 [Akkermansiaceae bacterium]|nr:hypothetical protein [Akkermansiaceae bacterium]MCP5549792.1 hypothetical protein [Akkermansiaceae bacterium]